MMYQNEANIIVKNLSVSYGTQLSLNNISVSIPRNRITAIIGPSGCGKTTLLKSFNRLLDLTEDVHISGSVFIDDINIYDSKNIDPTNIRKNTI